MATIEANRKRVENFPYTNSIESDLVRIWNKKNLDLHKKLSIFMETEQHKLTLSQKVILAINSLSEVSCTLVGMRKENYVDDVLISIKSYYIKEKYKFWKMEEE